MSRRQGQKAGLAEEAWILAVAVMHALDLVMVAAAYLASSAGALQIANRQRLAGPGSGEAKAGWSEKQCEEVHGSTFEGINGFGDKNTIFWKRRYRYFLGNGKIEGRYFTKATLQHLVALV